ncbi:aKG-HExxH-type peptide beta-hydroxylase [Pseudomonas sp. RIT-To-2]|uniref:aKG-HExxH-type peptide beta-hydroxylase n=1 Tax=Pseudomonas sp. RIT-To-2 TaxID=3462541 RepID=UPI0024134E8D
MTNIDQLMAQFRPSYAVNSFVIKILHEVLKRNETTFPEHLKHSYRKLSDHETGIKPISLRHFSPDSPPWIHEMIASTIQDLSQANEQGITILPPPRTASNLLAQLSIQTIKQHCPITFDLVKKMVTEAVLVGGRGLRGASSKKHLGTILVGMSENQSISDYIDTFTHEASHIDLYIRSFATSFISDPQHLLVSPIRSTPRPADAVLHATFVTARVALTLTNIALHTRDKNLRQKSETLATKNLTQAALGVSILQRSQLLTHPGEHLISNIRSTIDSMLYPYHRG